MKSPLSAVDVATTRLQYFVALQRCEWHQSQTEKKIRSGERVTAEELSIRLVEGDSRSAIQHEENAVFAYLVTSYKESPVCAFAHFVSQQIDALVVDENTTRLAVEYGELKLRAQVRGELRCSLRSASQMWTPATEGLSNVPVFTSTRSLLPLPASKKKQRQKPFQWNRPS